MTKTVPSPAPELDERGVQLAVERIAKAWNARDAAALAECMTEDVVMVGMIGERYDGREIVELSYRHVFDTILQGSRGTFTLEKLRFLKPDLALAVLHQTVTSHLPQSEIASTARQRQMSDQLHDSEARSTMTFVKRGRTWLVTSMHHTLVASVVTGRSR
jgi:uncharacterized protein (TIGR02246 family)